MSDEEKTIKEAEKLETESVEETEEVGKTDVYEIGYHLIPTIPEEKLLTEVSAIKDFLGKQKVVFISEDFPKLRPLSYMMRKLFGGKYQKFTSAYFGWVKFEALTESVPEIKKELDKNTNILRYLIIKTVKENTMATASQRALFNKPETGRFVAKNVKKAPAEAKVQVSEAELDKTIEELIVE